MKKALFFYMFSIFCITLSALIVEVPNDQIKIEDSDNFTRIRSNTGTNYTAYPGAPEIPLKTVFFEIPLDSEIAEITIIPQGVSRIELEKRIFPQQAAVPLLSLDQRTFSEADEQIYNSTSYPQAFLYNYGHGFCGDKSVGYAAIYTSEYFPRDQILEIPASFRLEIEFEPSEMQNQLPASKSSNLTLSELGLEYTDRRWGS